MWSKRLLFLLLAHCFIFLVMQGQSLYVGQSMRLSPPSVNGVLDGVAWVSDKPNNLSVFEEGQGCVVRVDTYFSGTATIDCTYGYTYYIGSKKYHQIGHTYYHLSCLKSKLSLDKQLVELSVGEEITLTYSNSSGYNDLLYSYWTTSDKNIATVDYREESHGVQTVTVTAIKTGECIITCNGHTGETAPTCKVVVKALPATSISVSPSKLTLAVGEKKHLGYILTPTNASSSVVWESSDVNIVNVNESGGLTAMDVGVATVAATTDNGLTSYCKVTVVEPDFYVSSIVPNVGQTDVDPTAIIETSFSVDIFPSLRFNDIELKNLTSGRNVEGATSIVGKTLVFVPDQELESASLYQFSIPQYALKNKWGSDFPSSVQTSFETTVKRSDIQYLIVWFVSGEIVSLPLRDRPILTYKEKNDKIEIRTKRDYYAFNRSDIHKYTFSWLNSNLVGISSHTYPQNASMRVQNDIIIISNLNQDDRVSIHAIDGKLISSCSSDSNGEVRINIQGWRTGAYIIETRSITFKTVIK